MLSTADEIMDLIQGRWLECFRHRLLVVCPYPILGKERMRVLTRGWISEVKTGYNTLRYKALG